MEKFAELPTEENAARPLLQQYLDEDLTAICLVIGNDPKADDCWTKVKHQATDDNVRAVRIRDVLILSKEQASSWRPKPEVIATFLTPEKPRRVSCLLAPPEASDGSHLYAAFVSALAGRDCP